MASTADAERPTQREALPTLGRYRLIQKIASGGMATVYLGRMLGRAGFARHVAIKVLHPHLMSDRDFVAMFPTPILVGTGPAAELHLNARVVVGLLGSPHFAGKDTANAPSNE